MLPLLLGAGRVLAGGTMRGMAARKIASSALQKNKPETQSGSGGGEEKDSKSTKKISSIKLLSGRSETARGGALVKASSTKIKAESFKKQGETISFSKDQFLVVETQVIKIKDLVISGGALRQSQAAQERKDAEKKSRESKEKSLESDKAPKDDSGIKVPPGPKLGFFERIKQFLFKMLVGWVVMRLLPYVPQMINFIKLATPAIDWVMNTAGFLLNGLVTFVDWGVKAVDGARNLAKKIGGDKTLELFDKFTSVFTTLVNGALILSMILLKSKGAASTAAKAAGGAGRLLSKIGGKLTGGIIKGGVTKSATRLGIAVAGKAGGRVVKGLSKALSKIPVIGGLIDFGINLLLGEPVGRAAAKAAGATAGGALGGIVAGAIGSVVPFAGTAIGGVVGSTLGSFLGDWAGGALYDAFAGAKKETQKMAGGGITRGGRTVGGSIQRRGGKGDKKKGKISRSLSVRSTEIKPGTSTGGEAKVKRIFPEPTDSKRINPLGYIKKVGKETSKARYFGPLFNIAYKTLVGNKPQAIDYTNAATAMNAWMYDTFSTDVLRGGTAAFAGGGEVNSEMFMRGEDLTRVVSKSLEDNIKEKVDKAINDLRKQLGLPSLPNEKDDPNKMGNDPNLEVQDGATVTGGNADFWTLVAISSLESGTPQGRADVAQSIYNRLASGVYGGKTIKELILRANQYQPVGESNTKLWHAISDKQSAIAAVASHRNGGSGAAKKIEETAAAIQNPALQKSAAAFVGGRTDFWAESLTPPANGIGYVNRNGHRFGWFVGPAAIAYGKKNPGPAKAPALGDIVVMGGGGKGGGAISGSLKGSVVEYITGDPNTPFGRFDRAGHGLPSNYHDHIAFKDRNTAVSVYKFFKSKGIQVTEFKGFDPVGGHASGSYHYSGLAFDVPGAQWGGSGAVGSRDYAGSAKVRKTLQEAFNNKTAHRGLTRVNGNEITRKLLKDEAVLDVDTSQALRKINPLLISELNKVSTVEGVMRVLREYASYEHGAPQEVEVPETQIINLYQSVTQSSGGAAIVMGGGGGDDFGESLAAGQ